MSQDSNTPRSGGLVPSQGIEWSFIWLVIGILGMVFLFFTFVGTNSGNKTPTYEGDRQIVPQQPGDDSMNQPEVGAPENTEST